MSAAPSEGKTKHVVYLNTHLFGSSHPGRFVRGLAYQDDKRAEAIARHILSVKPDVVILSQIWHANQATIIKDKVKEVFKHCWYPIVGKKWYLLRMDSGMMVLSKDPIEERDLFEFPDLNGYDGYSRKCVCSAVIDGVLIAGTDVQVGDDEASLKCRRKNITNIKTYLTEVARKLKTDRIVLVGDMNTREDVAAEHKLMIDEFAAIEPPLHDALRILHPSQSDNPGVTLDYDNSSTARRWGPSSGAFRVDYFFVSEKITVKQQETFTTWKIKEKTDGKDPEETEDVSDHYAISLMFE